MSEYIELKQYAKHMGINTGDVVFISSDSRIMIYEAIENNKSYDLNEFIDGLIECVGEEGTIIFPTYNWDFCKGKTFDYKKTPSKTGTIGSYALKRDDFKRTKHPIYSFAVYGRYQKELCNMSNIDSFGVDSPFDFFRRHNVKNYIIDVSLQHCFTYVHYVEQQSGVVKYRFIKNFTANYIDEEGNEDTRTYSMFVRHLDMDVEVTIDPIEEDLKKKSIEQEIQINSSVIKEIHMGDAYDIIMNDIIENKSRKLCIYKGQ